MRYPEAVDALRALRSRRPEMGTAATASLLDALGRPQDGVDVVQIAGTNGKGSTAELLSNVLQRAGLTVGVFTSPALNDLREQVRIDGRPVPKARFVAYIEDLLAHLDGLDETDQPTRFEALTALAVTHFGREDVDVAVLEVGIGGRYDSTSAVTPVASAVTTVSREHTDLLGEDVADIAREQAQVAPPDRPLVTGATGDALDAIRADTDAVTVGERDADVVARETGMRNDVESAVELVGPDWRVDTALSLLGQHQAVNAGVAAALARQLVDVDAETVARGLRATTWPGRFEIVERDPFVVLDGAHNPGAVSTLSRLLERYERDELHVVFGSMADKEYDRMVARLPDVDVAYVTRPETERAEGTAALADAFDGHADEVRDVASVGEATERAVAAAGTDDVVLVTGSLYVVGEARDRWTRALVPKHAARNPGE
ncbi:MAG: folylpolyglutamate synthase/dihydrofolate synthase family protein, partial [Halarchaeum sp.]